jgi:LysR family transcriptional regulator for bpeEF and oprC
MNKFEAMKVFTKVVETGSFTQAANLLDLPRASVSVTIQQLEALLKVRLLQRTTRRVSLTPDGATYYENCVRVLADLEQIENAFSHTGLAPQGKLRVDMPAAIGRMVVMPRIHEFHARYPGIELMVGFSDRHVDLIREGVDCVIRVGHLQDSGLVARRVGMRQAVTVASPAYLRRYGTPHAIEDLEHHLAVNYFRGTGRMMDFSFDQAGEPVTVKMKGHVAVNDALAYLEGGLDGLGIIQAARFLAQPHLESGALVEILPGLRPVPMPVSIVYPHGRHLPLVARAFIDWAAELFTGNELFA